LLAGWRQSRLTSVVALDALGMFSFRFALPALLFRLIPSRSLDRSFNGTFAAGYLASGLLLFGIVFGVSLIFSAAKLVIYPTITWYVLARVTGSFGLMQVS
jgi:malonate transporter